MDYDGLLSSVELVAGTGITYRQLDYWVRLGALQPTIAGAGGSGSRRRFSPADRGRIIALDAHLRDLEAQHLQPTADHIRLWWRTHPPEH